MGFLDGEFGPPPNNETQSIHTITLIYHKLS